MLLQKVNGIGRLAGKGVDITTSVVLAIFGILRLSRKAVAGFTSLPPGRRRSQRLSSAAAFCQVKSMRH